MYNIHNNLHHLFNLALTIHSKWQHVQTSASIPDIWENSNVRHVRTVIYNQTLLLLTEIYPSGSIKDLKCQISETSIFKGRFKLIFPVFLVYFPYMYLWLLLTLHLPPPLYRFGGKWGKQCMLGQAVRASYSFPNNDYFSMNHFELLSLSLTESKHRKRPPEVQKQGLAMKMPNEQRQYMWPTRNKPLHQDFFIM